MVYINSVQKNRYFNITYLLLICQSTSNRSNKYNEQVKNTPQQPLSSTKTLITQKCMVLTDIKRPFKKHLKDIHGKCWES